MRTMQIKDFSKPIMLPHNQLALSAIFKFNDRVFIKVSEAYNDAFSNSYDLSKKQLVQFSPDTEVEYVRGTLILHRGDWSEDNERQ